jgi:putative alpha-1,2-mannosidase
VDFGQCALSNQPSFHIPYIYSYFGLPDSTCYQVRRAVKELFEPTENGFPGDEDTGSMSAWYIFSSLGFYPVTPGTAEYVLASPSVKGAVIHTGYGTDFRIKTKKPCYCSAVYDFRNFPLLLHFYQPPKPLHKLCLPL